MSSHDWSTPLIRFRVTKPITDFYWSDNGRALRDMVHIKPDKISGMVRAIEAGQEVYILCRPEQFAYLITEFFNRASVLLTMSKLSPQLVYPEEDCMELDIVHASFAMPMKKDR